MEIKNNMRTSNVMFKGFQHAKSDEGMSLYRFNLPYDSNKYNCCVEFYNVVKNPYNYSYSVKKQDDQMIPVYTSPDMKSDGVSVDIVNDLKLKDGEAVAYRYKLTDKKNSENIIYEKDDDDSVCGDGCNLITRKGTSVIVHGPMCLAFPDSYDNRYIYAGFKDSNTGEIIKNPNPKDPNNFVRTFSNKGGGTLAGMEAHIKDLKDSGYKRFISTPILGGDNVSAHKYWMKKIFQPTSSVGNIDNFNSFQNTLFKNGMNYVSDGAYTSEGLEGVHFQYALRWMNQEDKPHEYYMFRMQGLQDEALGLGLVPKNMQNLRHKVVNSPNTYTVNSDGQIKISKNEKYNPKQPTYIQIFDNSLVTDAQRNDTEHLIIDNEKNNSKSLNKNNVAMDNKLAINTHDDTLINNAFIINPYEYEANIKALNSINEDRSYSDKIDLNSPSGTLLVSKFSGFEIKPKDEGGFVTWDANTDMAKLSYVESDYDNKLLSNISNPKERELEETKLARAHAGNRDMLADCMGYWTRHVRNLHTEYTAKTLGTLNNNTDAVYDRINSLIYSEDNKLPQDVELNKNVIENIQNNDYVLRDKDSDFKTSLQKSLMSIPLDSIEFADDTVGALSSPYISKRSPDLEHIGISRYDAMNDSSYVVPEKYKNTYNKMNNVFTEQMSDFATKVLKTVDKNSNEKIFEDNNTLTEYGQYVVPLVASDIAKYSLIKSLVPDVGTKQLKDGNITYDYENLEKNSTLKSIGINGDSPEDEANQIVNKIKKGINNFTDKDVSYVASSINKRLEDTNTLSFRFAEAMVDRSGLGLDWRIDAAKDVADMDSIRNLESKSDNQFSEIINVWSPAMDAVKRENPNSYIVAEFTDLYDLMKSTYGSHEEVANQINNPNARFNDKNRLANVLLAESGMNSEANYNYFFTAGLDTFGKDFTEPYGMNSGNANSNNENRTNLLKNALEQFAKNSQDYKQNTYTFGGNHDKPRMAECYALDMELFHSDLTNLYPEIPYHSSDESHNIAIKNRKNAYMILNDLMTEEDLNKQNPEYDNKTGNEIINTENDYFNNVSSMAVAKGLLLRSSIGIANKVITNERLKAAGDDEDAKKRIQDDANKMYAAFSKSIKDVVRGDYFLNKPENTIKSAPDSYKKQLEKDGFGSKDILTAYDIVINHANEKYDIKNTYLNSPENAKQFKDCVEKIALGIPARKVRMFTQMLNAIPGNPTTYAGDDLAMSGYEEKNHNLYLQNRNLLNWNTVEKGNSQYKNFTAKHKEIMDNIVKTRANDLEHKLAPLNNGTMYVLDTMNATKYDNYGNEKENNRANNVKNPKCPAILCQDADGSMTISIFNFNGLSTDNDIYNPNFDTEHLENALNPKSLGVDIKKKDAVLSFSNSYNKDKNVMLPVGLTFRNIDSGDKTVYKIVNLDKNDVNSKKVLIREENGVEKPVNISSATAPEGVLRLYYQPDNVKDEINDNVQLAKKYNPNFKGKVREYYNPVYNIAVSNPYGNKNNNISGSKLSIIK